MFFENVLNGTSTFLHILIALLFGIAPVALTIAIKVALYRRRFAEDSAPQPSQMPATESVVSTSRGDQPLSSFAAELRARLGLERPEYAP